MEAVLFKCLSCKKQFAAESGQVSVKCLHCGKSAHENQGEITIDDVNELLEQCRAFFDLYQKHKNRK